MENPRLKRETIAGEKGECQRVQGVRGKPHLAPPGKRSSGEAAVRRRRAGEGVFGPHNVAKASKRYYGANATGKFTG